MIHRPMANFDFGFVDAKTPIPFTPITATTSDVRKRLNLSSHTLTKCNDTYTNTK